MTSREATAFLPLTGNAEWRRDWQDWVWLLAVGAIQWPWLLKSLWGGRLRDKEALLRRLDLPMDALPNLGSWKADVGFLHYLVDHIEAHRPQMVMELGCGASSLVLGRALQLHGGGQLVSFDQHLEFVESTRRWLLSHDIHSELHHAPLIPAAEPWPGIWYDLSDVPQNIDLLVIDGPPWTLHPLVRGSASCLFDRVAPGGTIMLDDAARPGERIVAGRWAKSWPNFRWSRRAGIKGTLIGQCQNSQSNASA